MTSNRPYLVRAFYEWIVDNQFTPYILLSAEMAGVEVPKQFIENGKITLNISPSAVQDLRITNQIIEFSATFSGQPVFIFAPIKAVEAIYARENMRGVTFPETEVEDEGEPPPPPPVKAGKPKLTVVK